jgi:hypothetical protein
MKYQAGFSTKNKTTTEWTKGKFNFKFDQNLSQKNLFFTNKFLLKFLYKIEIQYFKYKKYTVKIYFFNLQKEG